MQTYKVFDLYQVTWQNSDLYRSRDLNCAIQRERFPLKTVDEVSGVRVFSKLDATSGFWHTQLDDESSRLCTFNTPFGRYRFTRMPIGIKMGPEFFSACNLRNGAEFRWNSSFHRLRYCMGFYCWGKWQTS
jgi:hypothetical protein